MRRKLFGMFCLGLSVAVLPLYLGACMFPTTADMTAMAKADHDWVADEHEAIRDQMTMEHTVQTPEFSEELIAINDNYMAVVTELRARVDAVEAKGLSLEELSGGFDIDIWGLLGMISPGLAGVGLWLQNLLKPSRAAGQVSKLEADAVATAKELADLKMELATAAKAGAPIPSDEPGSPA